ncbi:MAG: hypothetical protein FJX67_04465 [Alphaproteobacteria bacterium]|nr:hypothetical protein [Alphaproteobacteria bacterium]
MRTKKKLGTAALVAVLAVLATAVSAQEAALECSAATVAERQRLGLGPDAVENVVQARNPFSSEGPSFTGAQTYLYPKACRGSIVIDTTRGCAIAQVYAQGACTVPARR